MGNCISGVRNNHMDGATIDPLPLETLAVHPAARPHHTQHAERQPSLARPDVPADRPRASLLTNTQFNQSHASHAQPPGPINNAPQDIIHEVAEHLAARDKAALASVARGYRETLPEANGDYERLKKLLSQLNPGHGRIDYKATEKAMKLLGSRLHPDDRKQLNAALATQLSRQLSKLSSGTDDIEQMKKTVEHSLSLLDMSPSHSMDLATGIAPLLNFSTALGGFGPIASDRLRNFVASVDPKELTDEGKSDMGWTLAYLNRYGLEHLSGQERSAAFEQHLSAMERLYASHYRAPGRLADPLSSAQRQIATLPVEQRAGFQTRLTELQIIS